MENCPDIEIDIEKKIGNLSEEPQRHRFVSIRVANVEEKEGALLAPHAMNKSGMQTSQRNSRDRVN